MTNHIKILGKPTRIQYVADGINNTFEFPFAIFNAENLKAYFGDVLQKSTSYTINGVKETDGGSIVFNTTPPNGTIITLIRELDVERTSDFQDGGALRASVLNDELDYQIACQQQIADNLNRALVLPPYAVNGEVNLTLPIPSAGKAIVWNAEGTNLENSIVEVNALDATFKAYKTAAENARDAAAEQVGLAAEQVERASEQVELAAGQVELASEQVDLAAGKVVLAADQVSLAANQVDLAAAQVELAQQKANAAATSASTAASQATIATNKASEVSNALSGKANTSMNNLTSTGKTNLATLMTPDYSAIVSLATPTTSNQTMPNKAGLFVCCFNPNSTGSYYQIDLYVNNQLVCFGSHDKTWIRNVNCQILVPPNSTYRLSTTTIGVQLFKFIPLKGL